MSERRERRAAAPPTSPQESLARIVLALERIADALDGATCAPPRPAPRRGGDPPPWLSDLLRAAVGGR